MMAVTTRQVEGVPAAYPAIETPYYTDAVVRGRAAEKPKGADDWIWRRIEAYIAHRFVEREVVWTVEGDGDWAPPLTPAVVTLAQRWTGNSWQETTLDAGPYGYTLPDHGPYRITATVGAGPVPADVESAAKRMSDYCLHSPSPDGGPEMWATSIRRNGDGEGAAEVEIERPAIWIARALQYSGAADLLRPYRRA